MNGKLQIERLTASPSIRNNKMRMLSRGAEIGETRYVVQRAMRQPCKGRQTER